MDQNIIKLRELRKRARDAFAAMNAAMDEVKDAIGSMESAIDALEVQREGVKARAPRPTSIGPLQRQICIAVRDLGGTENGAWVEYSALAAKLPEMVPAQIKRSVGDATPRLLAQQGSSYRLQPGTAALLDEEN